MLAFLSARFVTAPWLFVTSPIAACSASAEHATRKERFAREETHQHQDGSQSRQRLLRQRPLSRRGAMTMKKNVNIKTGVKAGEGYLGSGN